MKIFFTQKKLLFSFFIFLAINSIGQSLRFTDTSYVNLGNASSLHLTNFTVEGRIKIEGYGSTTETGSTCLSWPNLLPSSGYEWYVEVSDGQSTTTGPVWTFTTPAQSITKSSAPSIETDQGLSQSKHGIQIYPNPASDRSFQIRINDLNTKKVLVSVYDMNGKLYLQKQYGSTNGIIVDHHLNPGVYIVKIVTENFTENRKLVIQ